VTGEITVQLWASSSAVDTDFTAKLIDTYPPNPDYPGGFDLNLEDGIVRARFRDSLKEEKLMTPGTIYPFTIKLYRPRTSLNADTASASTFRAAISPGSMSIQIPANRSITTAAG